MQDNSVDIRSGSDKESETQSGNNDFFYIPEGREVVLKIGETELFESLGITTKPRLIYTDELTIGFKSNYKDLVSANSNTITNLLSGATKGAIPSGQFALQGLQVWESTESISFNINVALHMNTSGKTDVVIPALTLATVCLPSTTKGNGKQGLSLIPPGPSLYDIIKLVGADITGSDDWGNRNVKSKGGGVLSITIGKFLTLNNVVMTSVEPTFSNILDEDYMPISCKLQIEFRTTEVATVEMVSNMISFVQGGTKK